MSRKEAKVKGALAKGALAKEGMAKEGMAKEAEATVASWVGFRLRHTLLGDIVAHKA